MMTAQDVNAVMFQKAVRGYRAEDVDKLLDDVAAQIEADAAEIESLKKANEELKANMYLLAQKIEEYRSDEENLKSALINAQRMGENVIREAKQKADGIVREASMRADGIVLQAQEENEEHLAELQRVKAEVGHFKADVLSLYKRHIESLSTLPEAPQNDIDELEEPVVIAPVKSTAVRKEKVEIITSFAPDAPPIVVSAPVKPVVPAEPEMPVVQEAAPAPAPVPAPAPLSEVPMADFFVNEPVQPAPTPEAEPEPAPAQEESVDSFWSQDENELKEEVPVPEKAENSAFSAFKGIKFSD